MYIVKIRVLPFLSHTDTPLQKWSGWFVCKLSPIISEYADIIEKKDVGARNYVKIFIYIHTYIYMLPESGKAKGHTNRIQRTTKFSNMLSTVSDK